MLHIKKEFSLNLSQAQAEYLEENLLLFDIETTGLSSKTCFIYLIGALFRRGDSIIFHQYFAENKLDEIQVLKEFEKLLKGFSTLGSYNGKSFDQRFIMDRCHKHDIDTEISLKEHKDFMKAIRPLKEFLGLPDLKQKTLELLLNTNRQDPYDGGKLIDTYYAYLSHKDQKLLDDMLIHNQEDVMGLLHILNLQALNQLAIGQYTIDSSNCSNEEYSILFHLSQDLPIPISYDSGPYFLHVNGSKALLTVKLYQGELKLFYDNPSDYYYLPQEDLAYHKSLSSFVDKSRRQKATAKTAYTRRQGLFLPLPETGEKKDTPLFYEDYKKACPYIWLDEKTLEDQTLSSRILSPVLQKFLTIS